MASRAALREAGIPSYEVHVCHLSGCVRGISNSSRLKAALKAFKNFHERFGEKADILRVITYNNIRETEVVMDGSEFNLGR